MALSKEVILNNGIPTTYHRIVSLNKIINHMNCIEVASYISQEKRDEEKEISLLNKESEKYIPSNIFKESKFIGLDYDENMTIQSAYDYLKTLDEFKDSIDV